MIFLNQDFVVDHLCLVLHLLVVICCVTLIPRETAIASGAGRTRSLRLRLHVILRHIFLIRADLPLIASPVGHVRIDVVAESQQDFLDAVGVHVHNTLNLLLAQIQSELLQDLDI